jgi:hypothetical protein
MMNRRTTTRLAGLLASLTLVAAIATTVIVARPADAWVPPTLSVQGQGCGSSIVRASNPENEAATVLGGNLFAVGSHIPAHSSVQTAVSVTGDYSVTVNYPSDQTHRTASLHVTVPDCPPTTTTSTTEEPSTTTTDDSPITGPPHDTQPPTPTLVTPAPAAEPVPVTPSITG